MAPPRFAPSGSRANVRLSPVSSSPAPGTVAVQSPSRVGGGSAPRFAPSGPVPSIGLGLRGGSRTPFLPSERIQAERIAEQFGGDSLFGAITSDKITPQQRAVLMEIAGRYNRPDPTLGVIFRILNLPVAIGSAGAQGAIDSVSRAIRADGGWDLREILEATPYAITMGTLYGGLREIPTNVWENRTFSDLLKENTDPSSWLYRHSMPIGLGLDIVADPTTYVSFGTTAASKAAATHLLARSFESSAQQAARSLRAGEFMRPVTRLSDTGDEVVEWVGTGRKISPGMDYDELLTKIHILENRPISIGDAMADLKAGDKARGGLRGTFARGGQGIRIAGEEVVSGDQLQRFGNAVRSRVGFAPKELNRLELRPLARAEAVAAKTAGRDEIGNPMTGFVLPTPNTLAKEPWRNYFPILYDKKTGKAWVGSQFNGHDDIMESAAFVRSGADPLDSKRIVQGTGVFDPDTGKVAQINWADEAGKPVQMTKAEKDRALRAAQSKYFDEGQMADLDDLSWVPGEKFYKLSEDALRALAMVETNTAAAKTLHETVDQINIARQFLLKPKGKLKFEDTPVVSTAEKAIRSLYMGTRPPYVPLEYRRGLYKKGFDSFGNKTPYIGQLRQFKSMTDDLVDAIVKQGEDLGIDPETLRGMWTEAIEKYDDPLRALGSFQLRALTRIGHLVAKDKLLSNPLFARVQLPGVSQYEDAAKEYDELISRWHTLNKKADKATNKGVKRRFLNQAADVKSQLTEARLARDEAKLALEAEKGTKGIQAVEKQAQFDRFIGQSTVKYKHRGKTYYVPQVIADALRELDNPAFFDRELDKWMGRVNWLQDQWKVLATVVNLSFHAMNLVGGMWNNMLGGVYNPVDYIMQYGERQAARMATGQIENAPVSKRLFPGTFADSEAATARRLAMDERGAGGGFVTVDVGRKDTPFRASMQGVSNLPGSVGKIAGVARVAGGLYGGAALTAAALPDEWVPDDIEDNLNPLLGTLLLMPQIVKTGRKMAETVEDVLRETPMRVAERDKTYAQLMDAYSVTPVTDWGRFMEQSIAPTKYQREIAWDIGAQLSLHYQFDYTKLSSVERYIAKTIFPFWTFYKNNFVLQAKEVAGRPRFVGVYGDIMNYANSIGEDEDNEYFRDLLPEYFDKLAMFRLPTPGFVREALGLPKDQDLYLNPKLPFASLNLFPPLWELANQDSLQPTGMTMAQILAPGFGAVGPAAAWGMKPLLEYSVGQNLGLARPIDYQRIQSGGYRNSMVDAPGFVRYLPSVIRDRMGVFTDPDTGVYKMNASHKYILEQMASPFINSTGDVVGVLGSDPHSTDKMRANAVAWMTGIRLTPVDPLRLQRNWLYRMENYLEGQKRDADQRGELFPPEDDKFLRQIRAQLKSVESAWDKQEAAIRG